MCTFIHTLLPALMPIRDETNRKLPVSLILGAPSVCQPGLYRSSIPNLAFTSGSRMVLAMSKYTMRTCQWIQNRREILDDGAPTVGTVFPGEQLLGDQITSNHEEYIWCNLVPYTILEWFGLYRVEYWTRIGGAHCVGIALYYRHSTWSAINLELTSG